MEFGRGYRGGAGLVKHDELQGWRDVRGRRRGRESNPRSREAHSFSKRAPGTDAGRPLRMMEEGVGVEPNSRSYAPASNGAASPLAFTFHAAESGGHDPHA